MRARRLMRCIKILAVVSCIVLLSGCNKSKTENKSTEANSSTPTMSEQANNSQKDGVPDLSTEEGIKEYLLGEWTCKIEYVNNNNVVKMNIDKDLKVHLSICDSLTNEVKVEYKGKIKLDRKYANQDEVPDLIVIELNDKDYPRGDFFFLNRTIYDGKRVMSLFFAGNGESIFNRLVNIDNSEDEGYLPEEIICEKASGEKSKLGVRKNEEFYAVFWGHEIHYESIWMDDVLWIPTEEDDYVEKYPRPMTAYENHEQESVLYSMAPGKDFDILGDDMFKGLVYFVQTDENGNIIELLNVEYKEYIEELVLNIIEDNIVQEIQDNLDAGMSILFTGEITTIDGEDCYVISLGTNHEDHFVKEVIYAVNVNTEQMYRLDVLKDIWESVAVG